MHDTNHVQTRRRFLTRTSACLGMTAVASLLDPKLLSSNATSAITQGLPSLGLGEPHFAPKAKNVIYLFMGGGPSHVDTFDPKPELTRLFGEDLPLSIRG